MIAYIRRMAVDLREVGLTRRHFVPEWQVPRGVCHLHGRRPGYNLADCHSGTKCLLVKPPLLTTAILRI